MIKLEQLYELRELKEHSPAKFKEIFLKLPKNVQEYVANHWYFGTARLNQIFPWHKDWRILTMIPSRGFGKNWSVSWNIGVELALNEELIKQFTGCAGGLRVNLFAESQSECSDVMILGESGIQKALESKGYELIQGTKRDWPEQGKVMFLMSTDHMQLRFPNKTLLRFYSSTKTRGKQSHITVCDEIFTYYETETNRQKKLERFHQEILTTTRLGPDPRIIYISTPQPVSILRKLTNRSEKRGDTIIVTGSTDDNKYLSKTYREELEEEFGNTRRGLQELHGIVTWEVPGALWKYEDIQRCEDIPSDISRIVVAVDPAVSNDPDSDETGIIVAAKTDDKKYYVLADRTLRGAPSEWARECVRAYNEFGASVLVYEKNQGGLLVLDTLRNIDSRIRTKDVWASRGKYSRAEPIAALYEQGKVFHLGKFKELEDQMVNYSPEYANRSPDRMDALVWALHHLSATPKSTLLWV